MKFYRLDEVPVSGQDQVFKISPVGKAIATILMFGAAATCLVVQLSGHKPSGFSPGAFYYFAAICAVCGLFALRLLRASLRPSGWLIRCNDTGIIIKYRSYQNWKFPPEDVQTVGIDYAEIASARLIKEHRISPGMDKHATETTFLTYVGFRLVNPDVSELESHLQAELNVRPDGMLISCDYPVQVADGSVEVCWNDGIRPSAHKAIEILGQRLQIEEVEHRKVDLTHHQDASQEEDRAKIVALVKSGDDIEAAKLARRTYGYNLTQATEFVEKIRAEG